MHMTLKPVGHLGWSYGLSRQHVQLPRCSKKKKSRKILDLGTSYPVTLMASLRRV